MNTTVIAVTILMRQDVVQGSTTPPGVLYLQLYPYITGQLDPDGSAISNLYLQLLPYITGQLDPDGSTISNIYLQLLPYITEQLLP